MIEAGRGADSVPFKKTKEEKYMSTVHNDKPTREAYKVAIARMVKNIGDEKTLALIYRYILYLYTGKR